MLKCRLICLVLDLDTVFSQFRAVRFGEKLSDIVDWQPKFVNWILQEMVFTFCSVLEIIDAFDQIALFFLLVVLKYIVSTELGNFDKMKQFL